MDHQLYMLTLGVTVFLSTDPSDDDAIDRLNRKYTFYALLVLAVISSARLFNDDISSLITCWNRANFPGFYINYTNYICFIANSYRLDQNQSIPHSTNDRLFYSFHLFDED